MNIQTITRRAVLPIVAAAALGAELTACGGGGGSPSPASAPATVKASARPAAVPTLSPGQLQFVSDMRNVFSFGGSVQASDLASFGQHVCGSRQSGMSVAGEVPSARRSWANISKGDAVQMIMLAERDICPALSGPQKVTYVVTGGSANVTYGPTGSDYQGSAPLSVTRDLGNPQYYSVNAQVNGGGSVTCKLQVDGVTISSASASGAASVASCEIGQDLNGSWEDTNASG